MRKSKQKLKETCFYAIITEDKKSSFGYIQGLLSFLNKNFNIKQIFPQKKGVYFSYNLTLAEKILNFQIIHVNSSPKQILEKAQELKSDVRTKYAKIFCVFDKDSHGIHYTNLKNYCKKNPTKTIDASSVPSFEYWLYLHFQYLDSPVVGTGNDSASDVMEKMLKKALPTYAKGKLNFDDFKNDIQTAVTNSQKSIARYNNDNNDSPLTYMGNFYDALKQVIT